MSRVEFVVSEMGIYVCEWEKLNVDDLETSLSKQAR